MWENLFIIKKNLPTVLYPCHYDYVIRLIYSCKYLSTLFIIIIYKNRSVQRCISFPSFNAKFKQVITLKTNKFL